MTRRFWLAAVLLALFSLTPVSAQDDSNRCRDGFRLFEHDLLMTDPVCIPAEPQRIAALDRFSFETLMALGVQPVASSGFSLSLVRDLPYLEEATVEVVNLGQPPNIELLLTVEPDLILSIDGYGEYDQLAAIAPTVQLNFETSADWQTVAAAFGDAANLSAEVEAAFTAYQDRLDVLAEQVGDPAEVEVSVVRVAPDYISLYSQDQTGTFLGVILGDAGFAVPSAQADLAAENPDFDGTVTLEQLPLVEGDVLLIWTFATSDEAAANATEALDDLAANPLWASLEVIQNEAAHVVGGYWIGSSFHAAHAVIDDLFTYVAGVDPSEVSPNPFLPVESE